MEREGSPSPGTQCIEDKFYAGQELYSGSTCCGISGMSEEEQKTTICEGGIDVGRTCDDPEKKDRVIQRCLDEYLHLQDFWDTDEPKAYKDLEPDDVTCAHLRRCRTCPPLCNRCFEKCNEKGTCDGVPGCESYSIQDGRRLIIWVEKNNNIETTCSCDHLRK